MTVKTTLSFTDRHSAWIARQVEQGIFATQSAAVAAAIESQIREEEEREAMIEATLSGMADEIRRRMETPRSEYLDGETVLAKLRDDLLSPREQ